jgi:hypothetical protein
VDTIYSVGLLLAFACSIASLIGAASAVFWRARSAAQKLVRASSVLLVIGAASGAVSLVAHKLWGHGAGSSEPMRASRFVEAHPAFIIVGFVLAASWVCSSLVRARIARNGRSRHAA